MMFRILTYMLLSLMLATPALAAGGAFKLTRNEVEDSVSTALVEAGIADAVRAQITSNRSPTLYQHGDALVAEINSLRYDENKSRWSANLFITQSNNAKVLSAVPLSGRYERMAIVPVLKHRLRRGDVIAASDLEEKQFPLARLRKGTLYRAEDLIGTTPSRVVSAGRAIRDAELVKPDIVRKGDIVEMTFVTPHMEIRTKGEALEAGAKGASIRIKNQSSGMAVLAKVLSPSEVTIQ